MARPPIDTEPLGSKLERLTNHHNALATMFQNYVASSQQVINTMLDVLENNVEDFQKKFARSNMKIRIEETIKARFAAHSMGDLTAYQKIGERLDALKKEAKENGMQSLYNKTVRKINKLIEASKHAEKKADVTVEELKNMPEMKIVNMSEPPTEEK